MSWVESTSAATSAVAAIIAVGVAGWSVFEGRRLLRLQTNPEIIVHMERNARFPDAADLVIANIGSAPAMDVRFHWSNEAEFFGLYDDQRDHIFILDNGITLFAPGVRYAYSVGIFREMDKSDVSVSVTYFRHGDTQRRKKMVSNFLLRPRELDGMAEWTNREGGPDRAQEGNGCLSTGEDRDQIEESRFVRPFGGRYGLNDLARRVLWRSGFVGLRSSSRAPSSLRSVGMTRLGDGRPEASNGG